MIVGSKKIATGKRSPAAGTPLRPNRLVRYGIPLVFFTCYFIFLLRYIDPAVIYSSNGIEIHNYVAAMHSKDASAQNASVYSAPPFSHAFILELTPAYAREVVGAPGGVTRCIVTLCIYACRYPVAGALAVTGLALFFYWIFSLYLPGVGVKRPFLACYIAPLFLLTTCAWYELRSTAFLLPVAGALACAVLYRRLPASSAMSRALWFSLLFWSAWYLMHWGCLLVLFFVIIHEIFSRVGERSIASVAITAAVNGALFFIVDAWIVPVDMAVRWNNFTALSGLPLAVIGFFPLAAVVIGTLSRFWHTPAGKGTDPKVQVSLLLCGIAAAAMWLFREPVNRDTRTIARTMHHVMNGQWEAILHENTTVLFKNFPQRAGQLQQFMVHAVDHALCRTGGMGDRLFTFPQAVFADDPLFMLETTHTNGYVNWFVVLDLAMDLGMVNTAEKIAGEIMENVGPYPAIIHRRALIQIAKGNNEAAAVYLNKLTCMPFYRREAKCLLGMLDNNSDFLYEPRISGMRASMDTTDYFLFTISYDDMLKRLLQSNPGNKAAYDYLMTFCLMSGRLDGLASLAPAAPAFGYTTLPRSWEEALCIYQAQNSGQAPSDAPFSGMRPQTVERFNEFAQACVQLTDDPAAAEKLGPAFGDSYFYFSIFRHSKGAQRE